MSRQNSGQNLGRPATEGDIRAAIIRLADATNWSASKIHDHLAHNETFRDRLPHVRTVQRLMRPRRRTDVRAEDWRLADASSEEARVVMEALATVIEESDGSVSKISRAEAAWIMKIKAAVPEMPTRVALRFAREYMLSEATAHLDAALAVGKRVVRRASGELDLDGTHVARHVDLHVKRWIDQPLLVWAGCRKAAQAYVEEIGHHASLSRPGEDSWFDGDFFGRLIIEIRREGL